MCLLPCAYSRPFRHLTPGDVLIYRLVCASTRLSDPKAVYCCTICLWHAWFRDHRVCVGVQLWLQASVLLRFSVRCGAYPRIWCELPDGERFLWMPRLNKALAAVWRISLSSCAQLSIKLTSLLKFACCDLQLYRTCRRKCAVIFMSRKKILNRRITKLDTLLASDML